jgi:hypothetical protein
MELAARHLQARVLVARKKWSDARAEYERARRMQGRLNRSCLQQQAAATQTVAALQPAGRGRAGVETERPSRRYARGDRPDAARAVARVGANVPARARRRADENVSALRMLAKDGRRAHEGCRARNLRACELSAGSEIPALADATQPAV